MRFLPESSSRSLLRTAKALARLRLCAGWPESLLVACVISIHFSCAGSILGEIPLLRLTRDIVCRKANRKSSKQGPVVQSVVSLTSSLRVISLTVLGDSIHNILVFFAEKM